MTTSNYLPPAILPTPPMYQEAPLAHSKAVSNQQHTIPNSLLGRPSPTVEETAANPSVSPAKMFVGGLPQSVTQETLTEYFGRYGNIMEAFVLMDEQSGRSRGFGFVTFENPASLNEVLAARPHYLAGKHVDCKHAVLKATATRDVQNEKASASNFHPAMQQSFLPPQQQQAPPPQQRNSFDDSQSRAEGDNDEDDLFLTGGGKSYLALSGDKWLEDCAEADERKIFVGGLPDVTPAEFASFFEHFGPVADAMVMFDRKRRRQRGFGFITFATNDGVSNALKYHRHPVKGKLVEVKKAHPLVLQKARAPARRERDQQLQAQQGQSRRGSPSLTSAKRKTSTLEGPGSSQAPWASSVGAADMSARTQDNAWKRLRPDDEDEFTYKQQQQQQQQQDAAVRPLGTNLNIRQTKFPMAPWNQMFEERVSSMAVAPPPVVQHTASPYFANTSEPKVTYVGGQPSMGPDQHYPQANGGAAAGTSAPAFYAHPFNTMHSPAALFTTQYKSVAHQHQLGPNDPYLSSANGYGVYRQQQQPSAQTSSPTMAYDSFYLNANVSGPAEQPAYTEYQPPFVKR